MLRNVTSGRCREDIGGSAQRVAERSQDARSAGARNEHGVIRDNS
jgi:hypothetical protein